jgi:hypothetical protein
VNIATASSLVRNEGTTIIGATRFIPLADDDVKLRSNRDRPSTANTFEWKDSSHVLPRFAGVPLIEPPRPSPQEARQWPLQVWLGSVIEMGASDFVAVLRDQTDPSRPDERVTIGNDEVDPQDKNLFSTGATFYWYISEEIRRGTRRTVTELRFRRLPVWSKAELDDVKRRAAIRARRFNTEWQHGSSE